MVSRTIGLVLGASVLLAAPAALAQSVHEIQVGGDTVSGTIADAADVDRVPFRLPEGALLTLSVKADKGSALHPSVVFLGTDRRPDPDAALVTAAKGNAVSLKNFAAADSGLRWLEIRGADGTTGGWTLAMKAKLPKKAAGTGTTSGGAGVFPFVSPGGATTTISVAAGKGSAALPVFLALEDPDGEAILADVVTPASKGFTLPGILLGPSGDWTLRFTTEVDGAFSVKVSFKLPKPFKRALTEGQVITDPVIDSLTPSAGDVSQVVPGTLDVDFAEPGCSVAFKRSPTVVTLTGPQLSFGPGSVAFSLNLTSFQRGTYSVEVVNADGGKDVLPGALVVTNPRPLATSVTPDRGTDVEVVTVTILGSFFLSGVTADLVRGTETIPGTSPGGSTASLQCDFDLRGRTQGLWDLVLTNVGAPSQTLASAFEILNSPPIVVSMSPGTDRLSSTFTASLGGSDMEATPTVLLRRAGTSDIAGTAVQWVSSSLTRAAFDTTGASPGARDLVLTNPDGQTGTLPEAFWMGGVAGPAVRVLSSSNPLDGPVSVAYDAARNEFAAAWIETSVSGADVFVQRLDGRGAALGSPVSVSPSASSVAKRDAVVAWDSTSDEYLVAWSEIRFVTTRNANLYQVFVRRVASTDLSFPAAAVQLTDHAAFQGWFVDEYNNIRTTMAWNPVARVWEVAWLEEWAASSDDWDVYRRTYNPANGALGTVVGVAYSGTHEADPCAVWDSAGSQLIVAYNRRTSTGAPLGIYLGTGGAGSLVASDSVDNLVDPQVAVDTTNRTLLLTWTRKASSGTRSVEAVLGSTTAVGTLIGSAAAVGSGTDDDFLARPLYNSSLGEARIAWTRLDSTPSLSVMTRRVDTSSSSGVVFLDSESEVSGGSGDESCPTVVLNSTAGETAVLWLKTMSLSTAGAYADSVVNGTYRGNELWIQRFR